MRMEWQKDRVLGFGLVYGTMARFLVDAYHEEALPKDEAALMAASLFLSESLGADLDSFLSELLELVRTSEFVSSGGVVMLPPDSFYSIGYVLAMLGENEFAYDEGLYNELKAKIDEGYESSSPSAEDLCLSLIKDVCPDGDLAPIRKKIKDLRVGG